MLEWEEIESSLPFIRVYRARVPGGWLVWLYRPGVMGDLASPPTSRVGGEAQGALTFYPDPVTLTPETWQTEPRRTAA